MIELLRRFGGKFRRYMVIGPACKLIEVIFDLLTPLVIAQMIDKGIGAHDVNAVVHYGVVLAAMAVIGISFTLVCQKMAALTSQGMGTDIRGALYERINKLSYAELDRFGARRSSRALPTTSTRCSSPWRWACACSSAGPSWRWALWSQPLPSTLSSASSF